MNKETNTLIRPPYDARKLVFVWGIHIITLAACVFWYRGNLVVSWPSGALAIAWFIMSSTAITAGYHRLFSHKTYEASPILEAFYLLAGAAAFQGSARQWPAQHRDHHTYVDQAKDPYNIKQGFWYAHMGWVVRQTKPDYDRVPDLDKDPLVMSQHEHFHLLAFFTSFALPCLIAAFWGEAIAGLLIAGCLRLVIQWHMTFCVNSVAHYWGSQKYTTANSARGNWWLSILIWGENDHNYHHAYPNDYRTGTRWYDFDPAKWLIWTCSKIGLAANLRSADPARVAKARQRTAQP